ncbi:MAG: TerD family protein [Deltaproteobacteria bacterium]|nr:TerD family protein [Deltaproteobacteria bacterium]
MVGTGPAFAVVDIETSGFSSSQDRVVSIGVVHVASSGEIEGTWVTLLNPGCDPGPVHVHGLTRERLSGAPAYHEISQYLCEFLRNRIFVAHNAAFDWRFLASEQQRVGGDLPNATRLCTLALARRLGLDVVLPDLRIGTLARHFGVPIGRPHDALEDAILAAGVLRHVLAAASASQVPLPVIDCTAPPRSSAAKVLERWTDPGKLVSRLVQGMRVVVTGPTRADRKVLHNQALAAGLSVKDRVTKATSVLICNDLGTGSAKLLRARDLGIPIIDESRFFGLLQWVEAGKEIGLRKQPGDVHVDQTPPVAPASAKPASAGAKPARAGPRGPLTGSRVLVVGGTYPEASGLRSRIVALGATAAVNLTGRVTHVVCLPGADAHRLSRIAELQIPHLTPEEVARLEHHPTPAEGAAEGPLVLPRGGASDLPIDALGGTWTVAATWSWDNKEAEVDVVAILLGADDLASSEDDLVFYNQPASLNEAVELTVDGPAEKAITVRTEMLPDSCVRVRMAAVLTGELTFSQVGPIEIRAVSESAQTFMIATLDAATTERTMLLADIYLRGSTWRIRAAGQGYGFGLDGFAALHGIETE